MLKLIFDALAKPIKRMAIENETPFDIKLFLCIFLPPPLILTYILNYIKLFNK